MFQAWGPGTEVLIKGKARVREKRGGEDLMSVLVSEEMEKMEFSTQWGKGRNPL